MRKKIADFLEVKCGIDEEIALFLSWLLALSSVFYVIISFVIGVVSANTPERCRVKSVADVIGSPIYAAGCIIGKDRFDYRLN